MAAASLWGNQEEVARPERRVFSHYRPDPKRQLAPSGKRRDATALVTSMVARLGDPQINSEERAAVVDALGHFGTDAARAVPALIQELDKSDDRFRRLMTASALVHIVPDEPRAVQVLWDAATDDDDDVGETALALLRGAISDLPMDISPSADGLAESLGEGVEGGGV
jgi:hypothetical protein